MASFLRASQIMELPLRGLLAVLGSWMVHEDSHLSERKVRMD